jgi:hypothetical protein
LSGSASANWQGHEFDPVSGFDAHQNSVFALATKIAEIASDLVRAGHGLAPDLEDDITNLDAPLGRWPARIDIGHDHALLAAPADLSGRRQR